MRYYPLTDKNFLLYAAQNYLNPNCLDIQEFADDLKRIKYIKKLLTKYIEGGKPLKERLILNHIIILNNIFGNEACVRMLYLKLKLLFHCVKPFLILLSICPDKIYYVGEETIINTDEIPLDLTVINSLRLIENDNI